MKNSVRLKGRLKTRQRPQSQANPYQAFDRLDGSHPWQSAVPDGYVLYPVRELRQGKVVYFNYSLAKEMGLIAPNHPRRMTQQLHDVLLKTFSIQIINEWDQQHKKFPKDVTKPKPYMATRYLQLQHENKKGKTSGDGRSIWNGTITHKGLTWDVSSRGTGVTCLSPGAVKAQKPLKTGSEEFGYGCGQAELDELFGSAVVSEIFHHQGIPTERTLVIIDHGKGVGIGVRAGANLIRPAHFFLYLKQSNFEMLKKSFDYFIERQNRNKTWNLPLKSPKLYSLCLEKITDAFARFAALLDRLYIFAWLDWDGDNVLAEAGIIDYGSIRQFGLRHDQYRYDDVERFSTNLNEQSRKARLTIQTFHQLVDYLESGEKKPLEQYKDGWAARRFDEKFEHWKVHFFLRQTGMPEDTIAAFMTKNAALCKDFLAAFNYLESYKSKQGLEQLPDGINRPALLNCRRLLQLLPDALNKEAIPSPGSLYEMMLSDFAVKEDQTPSQYILTRIQQFTELYKTVMGAWVVSQIGTPESLLVKLNEGARRINSEFRVTGNGAELVVQEIAKKHRRDPDLTQKVIDLFVSRAVAPFYTAPPTGPTYSIDQSLGRFLHTLDEIVLQYQEDI